MLTFVWKDVNEVETTYTCDTYPELSTYIGDSSRKDLMYSATLSGQGTGDIPSNGLNLSYQNNLNSFDVSGLIVSNMTSLANFFYNFKGTQIIGLTNWNTANVTSFESLFYNCSNLTSIDVSQFNTSNVTDFDRMFAGCEKITTIDVSNFNTEKATSLIQMFDQCKGLTTINVSNFDTSNVTRFGNMFRNCSNLRAIYCPNTWTGDTTKSVYSNEMFAGCTNLVGAIPYDSTKTGLRYANPVTGYFTPRNIMFVGDANGKAQKVEGIYIGVNGVAKSVAEVYVGVNGIAKKIYG